MPPLPTALSHDADVALRRAAGAALDVSGAYADSPAGFWPLGGRAAAVAPLRDGGMWVLVTCRHASEPGHAAHLRERSLTAAQRFALSLWLDGLDAVWTVDGLPDGDAVRTAGVAIGAADPVGLLWIPGARTA